MPQCTHDSNGAKMIEPLMDLGNISELYRCSRRHARDVITKLIGFPEIAPGSTPRNPLWLQEDVRAFLHRKSSTGPLTRGKP